MNEVDLKYGADTNAGRRMTKKNRRAKAAR